MRRRSHSAWGFTLIEVVVALALGGLVLVSAHALLMGVADRGHALSIRTDSLEQRATGALTLRQLVGQLEVGTPASGPFAGGPAQASFTSWCDTPSGWQERCAVTLSVERVDGAPALVARVNDGAPRALLQGFHAAAFRYLKSAADGGQGFESWGTGITAPVALGVLLDRDTRIDTLVVRIGERG
jgi:prepilin-type N-terminal cleavage/methylation domain-containing protein